MSTRSYDDAMRRLPVAIRALRDNHEALLRTIAIARRQLSKKKKLARSSASTSNGVLI